MSQHNFLMAWCAAQKVADSIVCCKTQLADTSDSIVCCTTQLADTTDSIVCCTTQLVDISDSIVYSTIQLADTSESTVCCTIQLADTSDRMVCFALMQTSQHRLPPNGYGLVSTERTKYCLEKNSYKNVFQKLPNYGQSRSIPLSTVQQSSNPNTSFSILASLTQQN